MREFRHPVLPAPDGEMRHCVRGHLRAVFGLEGEGGRSVAVGDIDVLGIFTDVDLGCCVEFEFVRAVRVRGKSAVGWHPLANRCEAHPAILRQIVDLEAEELVAEFGQQVVVHHVLPSLIGLQEAAVSGPGACGNGDVRARGEFEGRGVDVEDPEDVAT